MSAGVRAIRGGRKGHRRGFSLMELMVVVVIIGILTALAVPSMSLAMYDRDAYSDAGTITGVFRSARTRAIGRGGAVLIAMTADATGAGDLGTFKVYDAVSANAGGTAGDLTPIGTCKAPMNWTITLQTQVDGMDMNGSLERAGGIQAQLYQYTGAAPTLVKAAYVCFTPLGRSYVVTGVQVRPTFDGQLPSTGPFEIRVLHQGGATIRSVLVPPTGMARLFSHT